MTTVQPPASPEAEQSVIGQMLARAKVVGPIMAMGLQPAHFATPAMRVLFDEIAAAYYADEPMDALSIAERTSKLLMAAWRCDEQRAIDAVQRLTAGHSASNTALDHAKLIRKHADYRALLELAAVIQRQVAEEEDPPTVIAGSASQIASRIATDQLLTSDLVDFETLGRNFVREQQTLMAARAAGIEIGAYFGLSFIDAWIKGLRPSELWFLAGEPGAGKSAVVWTASMRFAERQLTKPKDRQIGTLVLSLEMAEGPSSTRVAQTVSALDGGKIREGKTDQADLQLIVDEWKKRRELPLWFNFSSTMRTSQLRALVIEAIRKYNVGLVVIDHFKYVDMDGVWKSRLEEEEQIARFLKQDLATQLNVAVICLAHTTKAIENREDRRPRLSDLRGSGQVAAHAEFVSFVHRPYKHATPEAIEQGRVKRTDAEMLFEKSRHGVEGAARFFFDPATMTIYAGLLALLTVLANY